MTMISFRVDDTEMAEMNRWAQRLHVDRSEFLREALRRRLAELAADQDIRAYVERPVTPSEDALAEVADWGPAEEWADWAEWTDAAR